MTTVARKKSKSKKKVAMGDNEDLIDPQGIIERKLPFYHPVQLMDRENMVEIFDEEESIEGSPKHLSPEAIRR